MKKTILVTNGRFPGTLDLIRNLANNGNRVLVAETNKFHYSSLSNAVSKNYLIESPRTNPEGYISNLLEIIKKEKVDLFLPGWEDVLTTAKYLDQFPKGVVFASDYSLTHSLHHKWEFYNLMTKLGYNVPETKLVKSIQDINDFAHDSFFLKSCYSRAALGTQLVNNKNNLRSLKLEEKNPFVVQAKLKGKQYCTYSVCNKGKIFAHATYPVHYESLDPQKSRGKFCLSFEEVHHKKIYAFVQEFAKKTGYTGSLAFDIFDNEGKLTPLECNPRFTCGLTLLTDNENLCDAYLGTCKDTLFPQKGTRKQLLVQSIFVATRHAIKSHTFKQFFQTLIHYKDITFNKKDKKPFFLQPILGVHYLIQCIKKRKHFISSYSNDLDFEG